MITLITEHRWRRCRDFVPVEQVLKVHKHFFDLDVSGVYNLGTGRVKSFMDVARDIASDTGADIVQVPMPRLVGYQRYTCADMTKTTALEVARDAINETGVAA